MNTTSATNPGAFRVEYRVSLRTSNGQALPSSWQFNYLSFSGKISINKVSSRINKELTQQFLPAGYGQYLDMSDANLDDGVIVWSLGSLCAGNNEPGPVFTFPIGQSSVVLFTVVVDASPGETIQWTNLSAEVDDCTTYHCNGPMTISTGGSTSVLVGAPPVCAPGKQLLFSYYDDGAGNKAIAINLANFIVGQNIAKLDATLHIVPEMSGIEDIGLLPGSAEADGGPILTVMERKKNTDGSFDVYFQFSDFIPTNTTFAVLYLYIGGAINLSTGVTFNCTMPSGRAAFGDPLSNPVTCSITGVPNDHVVMPGYSFCDYKLKIEEDSVLSSQTCSAAVRYTITHENGQALDLVYLKLRFKFEKPNGGAVIPGTVVTGLPDGNVNWVVTNLTGNIFEMDYEYDGAFQLASGTQIEIPLELINACCTNSIIYSEAQIDGNPEKCALRWEVPDPDICNPEIYGKVALPDGTYETQAPYYFVSLINGNGYILDQNLSDCQDEYSFCPDPMEGPFKLRVQTIPAQAQSHCGCGVTTYDLVLISKHILDLELLPGPYSYVAANASDDGVSYNNITNLDIVSIRKCILGITQDFGSGGAPSWRYISDSYSFPVQDPLSDNAYKYAYEVDVPSNHAGYYGYFNAVKIGDVNRSCGCSADKPPAGIGARQAGEAPHFAVHANAVVRTGNRISVPVYSDAPFGMMAAQAGFRFDPAVLRFVRIVPNVGAGVDLSDFGTTATGDGEIRFAWFAEDGETPLPAQARLFNIEFEPQQGEIPAGQWLWLSDEVLKTLAYPVSGEEYAAGMRWFGSGVVPLTIMAEPNPADDNVRVRIVSARETKATVLLLDGEGRRVYESEIALAVGENNFDLALGGKTPGLYQLVLSSAEGITTRRIVKF